MAVSAFSRSKFSFLFKTNNLRSFTDFLEYLVIAGGGAGASSATGNNRNGGGGGAGGYRSSVLGESSGGGAGAESRVQFALNTNYTVTIGAGGAKSTTLGAVGTEGGNSVFSTITSVGGGRGGSTSNGSTIGGSGGGGGDSGGGANGTTNQGFAGGGSSATINESGGGGGGAGGAGPNGNGVLSSVGVAGGIGVSSNITGTPTTRAIGGASRNVSGPANPAVNTGTGGTSGGNPESGNGAAGVVILRYPLAYTIQIGVGLTGSTVPSGSFNVTTISSGTGNVRFV